MINLALVSEFSYKRCFAKLDELVSSQGSVLGLADFDSTFGHYKFEELCKEQDKKPIFGARVMAVRSPEDQVRPRGQYGPIYILLSKNNEGLKEIYTLVSKATKHFYYRCHVGLIDIWGLSENVIVICESFLIDERIDYLGVSFNTPKKLLDNCDLPRVAINTNRYIRPEDKETYEVFAGRMRDMKTFPGHVLSESEWLLHFNDKDAVAKTYTIADECNVKLKKASMVRYYGGNSDIDLICREGAIKLGVDLSDSKYKDRYDYEMSVIKEKDFVDYFLIVSEMVREAKESILVGPGRGSAGGSLICYLMEITSVDPIKHHLLFERFITLNRSDLPDIDVDFPDKYRQKVIKRLTEKYGADKVRHLSNVTTLKARSTLREFAKELCVPQWKVDKLGPALIQRASGDSRFDKCIEDTFTDTETGQIFIAEYPRMALCGKAEGHARNAGVHAAALIVSNDELNNFASIDYRSNALMIEKRDTESANLLKVDCLGLSTLSILQDVSELADFSLSDYYALSFDDDKVFRQFREVKTRGIFQFEGYALQNLCRSIKVKTLEELSAINALSRPGPLHGGSTQKYCDMHSGKEIVRPIVKHPVVKEITDVTLGNLVYQEQVMEIARRVGGMNWDQVSNLRKVISKSKGGEEFDKLKESFIEGATNNDLDKESAEYLWQHMATFGAYGFNRAHALAYSVLSYWTAWAKTYYPNEFTCAFLNNTKDAEDCIKLIREMQLSFGVKVVSYDEDKSALKWFIDEDGSIIGPLTNIKGVGTANARKIIKCRKDGTLPPRGIIKKLVNPQNEFDVIFPCRKYWGDLFDNYSNYGLKKPPHTISMVRRKGTYTIVGKLTKKMIKDLNDANNVKKRDGKVYTHNHYALNLTFEDDTDQIMGRIGRDKFDYDAQEIIDDGREDTDWYLVTGKIISDDIRFLFIEEIHYLGDGIEITIDDLY